MNSLIDEIDKRRVIVCCGSGGVGKTSVSAAIALMAAKQGKKAIVITIDPAKRLATSLGVDGITDRPKDITKQIEEGLGEKIDGTLSALMLDTKGVFDRMILDKSPNEEFAQHIIENRLYQILASQYAGTQEFMAVQQLSEIIKMNLYDLIVLDTPPTRHALDFLDAPKKLSSFFDDKVIGWFAKPASLLSGEKEGKIGGFASKLFQTGTQMAFQVFEKLVSTPFVDEFSVFISSFYELRTMLQDVADHTEALLSKDQVGFLLVSSPEINSINEARFFHEKINSKKLAFIGFVVNRMVPNFNLDLSDQSINFEHYQKVLNKLKTQRTNQFQTMEQLGFLTKNEQFVLGIPEREEDIHHATSLKWLANQLFFQKDGEIHA